MKRIFALFLILLFLFTTIVFADTFTSPYDTSIKGYGDREIFFIYDSGWYNWLLNNASSYMNDNYYFIIFSTSNINNSFQYNYALFIEKSSVSGKPFNINLAQNSLPR